MLLPVQNRVEVEPEVLEAWYLFQLNGPTWFKLSITRGQVDVKFPVFS